MLRLNELGPPLFGVLLAGAGLLWFAAALVFDGVEEFPGETAGGRNALGEAWQRLELLRSDRVFRRFVVARALALCSALSAPYYVWLARELAAPSAALLGLFVIAAGFAAAPFWGRFANRSSRRVLAAAAAASAVIGCIVAAAAELAAELAALPLFMPGAWFLLMIAHSGVRVGRKTYVLDLAGGDRRTDYTSPCRTR